MEKTKKKSTKILRTVLFSLIALALAYALFVGIALAVQINGWMHPKKVGFSETPAESGLDYYTFSLKTPSGTVVGWMLPAQQPQDADAEEWVPVQDENGNVLYSDKTVVFSVNYDSNRAAEDIGGMRYFTALCQAGYNVVTFDWTGSGYSDGKTNVFDLNKTDELNTVIGYVRQETGCKFLALQGIGFGCGPVAFCGNSDGVDAVILDSPYETFSAAFFDRFSSWATVNVWPIKSLTERIFPKVSGIDFSQADLKKTLAEVPAEKVLLIGSERDEIFGPEAVDRLAASFGKDASAHVYRCAGATHLRAFSYNDATYLSAVFSFLDGLCPSAAEPKA